MELTKELEGTTLKVNGVEVTVREVHNAYNMTVECNGRSWQANSAMKIENASSRYSLRGTV